MAPQKQQRLLKQHPEIVVATPGRLWELISEVSAVLKFQVKGGVYVYFWGLNYNWLPFREKSMCVT